jgi:uroporphyrinogen-III synthase
MTVLVTRPEPHGQRLCHQLQDKGIRAVYQPLIRFREGGELPHLPSRLTQADIVIAVSQPAVTYSHQYLQQQQIQWPDKNRYLAIGQKTAQLFSKLTQQAVNYPNISDSEHFIMLPDLQCVSGLIILILRGNQGRELIAQQLMAMGAQVNYCEVYRRETIPFNAQIMVPDWQQQSVKHIVVTSEEQLNFFIAQASTHDNTWLLSRILYVPSKRIAQYAQAQGFNSVITVGSASNSALLAAIQAQESAGIIND